MAYKTRPEAKGGTQAGLLIENIGQLVRCTGPRGAGAGAKASLAICEQAVVLSVGDRVRYAGPAAGLDEATLPASLQRLDAEGGLVTPGFVDPHTHLAFAGDRAEEFALRCEGLPYEALLKRGGGILSTVRATREASLEELAKLAEGRLRKLLLQGVTTVEVKSGYALTTEGELLMLEAIGIAAARLPMRVERTLLGAHALPPEYAGRREDYVSLVCSEMAPEAARRGLATHLDAFVETAAFTPRDAKQLARAAEGCGLGLRLHVDQLTAGAGAQLAAELGARSADHLEQISAEGIAALAESGCVAGILPTATLYARLSRWAPGRALTDAGAIVALGTNLNPGTAMCESHGLILGLACLWNGLSPAEALLAATDGAARALGLEQELGHLSAGSRADLVVHRVKDYRQLCYQLAGNFVTQVVAGGERVFSAVPNPSSEP